MHSYRDTVADIGVMKQLEVHRSMDLVFHLCLPVCSTYTPVPVNGGTR